MDGFGVGVSVKLPDGTMIWIQRDQAAELIQDLEQLPSLLEATKKVAPQPPTPEQAEATVVAELGGQNVHNGAEVGQPQPPTSSAFEQCPVHSIPKDKWVPPGFSERTKKNYPGFYACPMPGCRGR